MKGLIFDIQRFSLSDGPGIRTTVFFKGCPLHCLWCHNPEAMLPRPELLFVGSRCRACGACARACMRSVHRVHAGEHVIDRDRCRSLFQCAPACPNGALRVVGYEVSAPELVATVLRDRAYFDRSGGGVTLSGGEPTFQAQFAARVAAGLREEGVHVALDTCGHGPWDAFADVVSSTDLVLFDLKLVDSTRLRQLTGASMALVLENLDRILATGTAVVIRFPLIPGLNDDDEHLNALAALVRGRDIRSVDVIPYHGFAGNKYEQLGRDYPLRHLPGPDAVYVAGRTARLVAGGLEVHVV